MALSVLDAVALALALVSGLEVLRRRSGGTVTNLVGFLCLALAGVAAGRLLASLAATDETYWHALLASAACAALATGALVTLGAALGFAPRHPWPLVLGAATVAVFLGGGLLLAQGPVTTLLTDHQRLLAGATRRLFGGHLVALASVAFVVGALLARRHRGAITRRRLLAAAVLQAAVGLAIVASALAGDTALAVATPLTVIVAAVGHALNLRRFRPASLQGDAFAALYDHAGEPMIFVNLDAMEVRGNGAAAALLGPSLADPVGVVRRLGLGETVADACEGLLCPGDRTARTLVDLEGRSFELSVAYAAQDALALLHLTDITERVRATEAAEQALAELADAHERMVVQEKMAALGSLISGVSHEINNPVAYVGSNLRVLRDYLQDLTDAVDRIRAAGEDPAAAAGFLDQIRSERFAEDLQDAADAIGDGLDGCERIATIVGSMRTLSRQNEPEQDTNLAALAGQAVKIARTSVNPSIQVLTYLEAELPVRGVPGELSRVCSNLVVNAGQALGDHGTITVAGWIEGGTAVIEVADDGPGIPGALRTRIFEPFFTTKGPGEGTGLGLSISYETVRRHGGELVVRSTLGQGTRFQVRLPVVGLDTGLELDLDAGGAAGPVADAALA